jgi:hypothetical protein
MVLGGGSIELIDRRRRVVDRSRIDSIETAIAIRLETRPKLQARDTLLVYRHQVRRSAASNRCVSS